jgi:hypothetical protein
MGSRWNVSLFWRRSVGLAACAIALSAQTGTPPKAGDVVVTGERLTPEEARSRAAAYVRAAGVANGDRSVARWIDPICPRVLGLEDKLARYLEGKVRAVATAAGAPLAAGKCTPNIAISFVTDASALVRSIAARQPRRMSEVTPSARDALSSGTAPIRWWYSTEVRDKNGGPLLSMEPPFTSGGPGTTPGQVLPTGGDSKFLATHSNSLVGTQVARAIRSATVIVDVGASTGARLDGVADYAALVALAEIRPSGNVRTDSILGLFDAPVAPGGLTEWDSRFLRELYRLRLDRNARLHRGKLAAALVADQPRP